MLDKTSPSALKLTEATRDAEYFEYTSAANPIGAKLITTVPYHVFKSSLYDSGPTRVVPLDLSKELVCEGPATAPGLLANFVRILPGEAVSLHPNATSLTFYVLEGSGAVTQGESAFPFGKGDFFALPGGAEAVLAATSTTRIYYVNDAPLLAYLGVEAKTAHFSPTLYPAARAQAELEKVANDPAAAQRNRVSILLGNANFPQTRTVTHVGWAMFGTIAPGTTQRPHRHQSVALDFIPDCKPGVYTLVGAELDANGAIVNPVRVDWEPGMSFVTPPGHWHAHFNESGAVGYVIPFQDAGLHTYLRTLDIRFAR